jgi:hypothetical protein
LFNSTYNIKYIIITIGYVLIYIVYKPINLYDTSYLFFHTSKFFFPRKITLSRSWFFPPKKKKYIYLLHLNNLYCTLYAYNHTRVCNVIYIGQLKGRHYLFLQTQLMICSLEILMTMEFIIVS